MAKRLGTAAPMLLIGICVVLVASCTGGEVSSASYGAVEFAPGEGPLQRSRTVRIEQVATGTENGAVTVSFIGGRSGDIMANPCDTDYELEVDEATSPATMTVWQVVPSTPPKPIGTNDVAITCTAEGHARRLHHQWSADPQAEIRDGSNDQTLAVINVAGLLAPNVLPAGWTLQQSDAPDPPDSQATRFTDGTSTVFMYVTLHENPINELEIIRTGPDFTEIEIRDGTRAETSTFEDRAQLRFVDGSYLYRLSADQEVDPAVLIDIANGLRE